MLTRHRNEPGSPSYGAVAISRVTPPPFRQGTGARSANRITCIVWGTTAINAESGSKCNPLPRIRVLDVERW